MNRVWLVFWIRYDDPEVQRDIKFLPYKVVKKDGKPYVEVQVKGETKVFSPEEISAMVLGKMKETAEQYLGKEIKDAVITVPGLFHVLIFCSTSGYLLGFNGGFNNVFFFCSLFQ